MMDGRVDQTQHCLPGDSLTSQSRFDSQTATVTCLFKGQQTMELRLS